MTLKEKKGYEDLMRWVMNDLRDLPNDNKKLVSKHFNQYLMNAIMALDIFNVINNNNDFLKFKDDLLERIGRKN